MDRTWLEISRDLTPERISILLRPELSDGWSFEDMRETLEDIAFDAQGAASLTQRSSWDATQDPSGESQATKLQGYLDALETFDPNPRSNPDAAQDAQQLRRQLRDMRRWLITNVRPYARFSQMEIAAAVDQARASAERARDFEAQLETAVKSFRADSTDVGATSGSTVFEQEAKSQARQAKRALIGLFGFILVLVGVSIEFLVTTGNQAADTGDAILAASGRFAVLAALAYGIPFSARNYRAHKHLEAVCRFKANTLKVTPFIYEGSGEQSRRDIVLSEMVRSVFASPETGFGLGGDPMILTSPVSTLISQRRTDASS